MTWYFGAWTSGFYGGDGYDKTAITLESSVEDVTFAMSRYKNSEGEDVNTSGNGYDNDTFMETYQVEEFVIHTGSGDDFLDGQFASRIVLYSSSGDDFLGGSVGNDRLYGGSGMNTLVASAGNDLIEGGSGTDILYLSGTRSQYTFSGNRYDLVAQGSQASGHGRKTIGDVEFIVIDGQTYTANELLGIPNAPPRITSNGGGSTASISIAENGRAVTTVKATDSDAIVPQTYSIVGGDDAARFSINASTGALTFVNTPNAESPNDTGANNVYQDVVQVSDGSDVDTRPSRSPSPM